MFTKDEMIAAIRSIEGQPPTGQILRIEACVQEVERLYAELSTASRRGASRATTWRVLEPLALDELPDPEASYALKNTTR